MELRLNVDDAFMSDLTKLMGSSSNADVVREALTILKWAIKETARHRVILSADADGKNVNRLITPKLEEVAARVPAEPVAQSYAAFRA